jgi:hypothetical protein
MPNFYEILRQFTHLQSLCLRGIPFVFKKMKVLYSLFNLPVHVFMLMFRFRIVDTGPDAGLLPHLTSLTNIFPDEEDHSELTLLNTFTTLKSLELVHIDYSSYGVHDFNILDNHLTALINLSSFQLSSSRNRVH